MLTLALSLMVLGQNMPTWTQIDNAIAEQKFEAASGLVEKHLAGARAKNDEPDIAKSLVKLTILRVALGGYETAVKQLKAEAWPNESVARALVELAYASSLNSYQQAYRYEISQREKIETKGTVDLTKLTNDQLRHEIDVAYKSLWARRESLGKSKAQALRAMMAPGTYPPELRDTARDAVTYFWVEALANTANWTPEESNSTYTLDLNKMANGADGSFAQVDVVSEAVHPLMRATALLDDVEKWHRSQGQLEAAFFARIRRLSVLRDSFSEADEQALLAKALERVVADGSSLPVSAYARARLAEWYEQRGDLRLARDTAAVGAKAFPQSVGGQQCAYIAARLEAPDFSLQTMSSDGAKKRSVVVSARNMKKLYVRAYRLDAMAMLDQSDSNPFRENQIRRRLKDKALAEWTVDLPATVDLKHHQTFVTPPMADLGTYLMVFSAEPSFAENRNRLISVGYTVTQLAYTNEFRADAKVTEVVVRDGATGAPLSGVDVELWATAWNAPRKLVQSGKSDSAGVATIAADALSRNLNYNVVARRGQDILIDGNPLYFYRAERQKIETAVVYTDRAVYRPQQRIQWKVVRYRGDADRQKYTVVPNQQLTVTLRDVNSQEVGKVLVTTNAFGSASGEFTIPTGKLLGNWQVDAQLGGSTIRVEEYKRPTFEVTLNEPKTAMKLNAPATLSGNVKYYYGLAVTNGALKYRVKRQPQYPWWMCWWGIPPSRQQVVGSGTGQLKADGTFEVTFTAAADPKLSKDVTYNYELEVDVTDEGGETRSATRSVRLGQVSVEASFGEMPHFVATQAPFAVQMSRTDLNGAPRQGKGSFRVNALQQPASPLLPADEPLDRNPNEKPPELITAGDEVRPRFGAFDFKATLRRWKDGAEVARGEVLHAATGLGDVKVAGLAAGAYRLHYETVDDFGSKYEMATELLVVGSTLGSSLPAFGAVSKTQASVGDTVTLAAGSGFAGQPVLLEVFRGGKTIERKWLTAQKDGTVQARKVTSDDRGGFVVHVSAVRDFQNMQFTQGVTVPWEDKALQLEYSTFRDTLRPGGKETFRLTVKNQGKTVEAGSTEVVASMYDQSLDLFGKLQIPNLSGIWPTRTSTPQMLSSLRPASAVWTTYNEWYSLPAYASYEEPSLVSLGHMGIGGMGSRGGFGRGVMSRRMRGEPMAQMEMAPAPSAAPVVAKSDLAPARTMAISGVADSEDKAELMKAKSAPPPPPGSAAAQPQVRSNFAETAFFFPHLVVDAKGQVGFEFEVPDSVTAWNVWAHAVQPDLKSGSVTSVTRSIKELMVRPVLPRFLREGDDATIKVLVSNGSKQDMEGQLTFDLLEPQSEKSVAPEFQMAPKGAQKFSVKAGQSTSVAFRIVAPRRVGEVAVKVVAKTATFSDGELRILPLLPSRMHLAQSRFVTLKDRDEKKLQFADLAKNDDPTLVNEKMVVTVDAQLFYSVLSALPYLIRYPYECTEQTVNRFVSAGIVSSVFRDYPQVATMAKQMAERKTAFETFDAIDPNRKIQLEESPWLNESKGGSAQNENDIINMLRPDIVIAERQSALAKLAKMQLPGGGFPWFAGGPPSTYMTLYLLGSFSKAAEFKVEVPKDMIQRAFSFVAEDLRRDLFPYIAKGTASVETATLVAYVASNFPDTSYLNGALSEAELASLRDYSFKRWKQHSPLLKGMLALTLKRAGRGPDAKLVFDSVMDSAKTTPEDGTFWQPEARGWLWYQDNIEGHAFGLRVLQELNPKDPRRVGMVQWLLLNKKLNHWKSTRATAEVIYSLTKYLEAEKQLGLKEESNVVIGNVKKTFVFEPTEYTGKKNQLVIDGKDVDAKTMSTVTVSKASKGFQFASATWHFSTDKLPSEERGDLFNVRRKYFRREKQGTQTTLKPLEDGARLQPGDELEVQLSIQARQAAEYVHLRDPRGAGFEPEGAVSRYKYDLGIVWYEEYRDSGTNFFFERLPAGEYTFKYRVRAATQGVFRVGPSTLQSMYAPEFTAYSTGQALKVEGAGQ